MEKALAMGKAKKYGITPRERLPKIIDIVDDKKVNANLTHFQDLVKNGSPTYTDELVIELDMDYDNYLNGGKTYSGKEVKIHTQKLLKSLRIKE